MNFAVFLSNSDNAVLKYMGSGNKMGRFQNAGDSDLCGGAVGAAADLDMTANPSSAFELLNRLRFSTHMQQHHPTLDIDEISIIVSAFLNYIHRH
jgi:hypothetical protein